MPPAYQLHLDFHNEVQGGTQRSSLFRSTPPNLIMFFSVTGYMNLYLYILRWCLIIQVFSFVSQKENECPTIQTQIRMLRIVVMNILWAVKGHVSMLCDVLRLERSLSGPQEMCWGQYHLLLRYLRAEREKHDSEQWRKTKRLPRSYQNIISWI